MSWKDSDTVRKLFVGNSAAKSVLRCLADHRNEQTGQCNPSADAIAWETELNKKTVYKAITYLEEKGFIRRERRVLNSSNNYVLNLSDPRNAENGTSTKNGSTKFGSTKNGSCTKNGISDDPKTGRVDDPNLGHESLNESVNESVNNYIESAGSTKNGSCTKNGISDDPKTGRVDDPNLGHESLNESVNESVNNYIESAPDFSLTSPENPTSSKKETVEKKAKRQKKEKVPCPYNEDEQNNYIESAPDFSLTSPENPTSSKKETVEKKAKRQKKEKVPCPYNEDEQIPEEFLKVAQKHNIQDPQQLFSKMVAYCKANGKQYADYKAAFTTWCLNESKWQQQKPANQQASKPYAYEPPGGFTEEYYREQCKFDKDGNLIL